MSVILGDEIVPPNRIVPQTSGCPKAPLSRRPTAEESGIDIAPSVWSPDRAANTFFGEVLIREGDERLFGRSTFPPGIEAGFAYPCSVVLTRVNDWTPRSIPPFEPPHRVVIIPPFFTCRMFDDGRAFAIGGQRFKELGAAEGDIIIVDHGINVIPGEYVISYFLSDERVAILERKACGPQCPGEGECSVVRDLVGDFRRQRSDPPHVEGARFHIGRYVLVDDGYEHVAFASDAGNNMYHGGMTIAERVVIHEDDEWHPDIRPFIEAGFEYAFAAYEPPMPPEISFGSFLNNCGDPWI